MSDSEGGGGDGPVMRRWVSNNEVGGGQSVVRVSRSIGHIAGQPISGCPILCPCESPIDMWRSSYVEMR